ncbi:MAG: amino acid ABC transporter permease [Parvibaculaceae bacterium]
MQFSAIWSYIPLLLAGLQATILISIAALCTSLVMGVALAAAGRSANWLLRIATRIYTEIILGIPVLVLVYVIFFVFPDLGMAMPPLYAGILALTLYYAPYMAEVIRGAIAAVPPGQVEAAQTVGMSGWHIATRVIGPQAMGIALPALAGISIGLCKDTALLSVISVVELSFQTKQVVSRTYAPFETYVVVAAMYWVVLTLFEIAVRRLETRMTRYRAA